MNLLICNTINGRTTWIFPPFDSRVATTGTFPFQMRSSQAVSDTILSLTDGTIHALTINKLAFLHSSSIKTTVCGLVPGDCYGSLQQALSETVGIGE